MEISFVCGEWSYIDRVKWEFVIDVVRGRSLSTVPAEISYMDLVDVAYEDYAVDESSSSLYLSYKPSRVGEEHLPPCYIRNDRQLATFLNSWGGISEVIQICVTFRRKSMQSGDQTVLVLGDTSSDDRDKVDDPSWVCHNNALDVVKDTMANHDDVGVMSLGESCAAGQLRICDKGEGVYAGKFHPNKKELMKEMRLHALKQSFEFRTRLSDARRVVLRCVDSQCIWKFTAYSATMSDGFIVCHYMTDHTCDTTMRKINHRQATARILGEMVSNHFEGGKVGLKPKQIMENVRNEHGVNITYWKAYKAQEHAQEAVRGCPDENYHLLPKWFHVTKEKNPGSVTYLEMEPDGKFKYAFIAYGASIRGFRLLRKIIAVDGAFLKSKFRGTLLGATAQDGNFQLYPIAFGIVDSENDDSWDWFFRCLKSIIPDEKDLMFVSDRHLSIAKGISTIYPLAHHGICTFHFERNIATKFKKTPLMPLVHEASRAYTERDFHELFTEIKESDPSLAKYLESAGFAKWSKVYSRVNRFNIMTTNIAESLNAMLKQPREYPVVFLLETIRSTLTRWFHDRFKKACEQRHHVTMTVGKIMKEVFDLSRSLEVFQVNESVFEVKGDSRTHIVDLSTRQCTCRKFDLDGYPCTHAFAAVKRTTICENSLVTDYYSNKRLIQIYSDSIIQLEHKMIGLYRRM